LVKTHLSNSEAIGIQDKLKRCGAELEQMCNNGYDLIDIEQIHDIKNDVLRFQKLEPNYKQETVKTILHTIAAAISIWKELKNRAYFYGYMDSLHPLLKNF
jgi:hypothetical protein